MVTMSLYAVDHVDANGHGEGTEGDRYGGASERIWMWTRRYQAWDELGISSTTSGVGVLRMLLSKGQSTQRMGHALDRQKNCNLLSMCLL